jgi:hypothetical protein
METAAEIERKLLDLPAADRERLALKAWDSLVADLNAASDPNIDPEGVKIAAQRDTEMDAENVEPIDQTEFRRRTGGVDES